MEEIYVLEDLLNTLIELEIKGFDFYQSCNKKAEDFELQQLFHELATAEKNHEIFYKQIKQKVTNHSTIDINEEYKHYIDALIDNNFSIDTLDDKTSSIKEVLDIAEKIEKDTILFLNEISSIVNEEYGFKQILEEEKRHLLRIYHYKKTHKIT